jgi:hypothetical protein
MKLPFKVFCDNGSPAGYTPESVGESDKWAAIVNLQRRTANYCKFLRGKTLFKAVYRVHTVALNKLKSVLKASTR